MRTLILLVSSLPLFFCCQSPEKYKVENAMMECFTAQYNEYGIDVSGSLDSANSILIDHNILPNISGKSFIKMLQDIRDSNGLPFKPTPELITSLRNIKHLPNSINCRDSGYISFDSIDLVNSKFINFIVIFDSIAQREDISVRMMSNDFLLAFDEQDFDHPLYSAFGTLLLSNLIKTQNDKGIASLLAPSITNYEYLEDSLKVILEISMLEDDKLLANGIAISESDIVDSVERFIKENEPSGIVKVTAKRSVSYELYIRVLDDVNLAYDYYYDTKSMNKYGQNYKKLTREQQSEISTNHPRLISISELEP